MDNGINRGGNSEITYKIYNVECSESSLTTRTVTSELDGAIMVLCAYNCNSDGHKLSCALNGTSQSSTHHIHAGYYRYFTEYIMPVRKGDVVTCAHSDSTGFSLLIIGVSGNLCCTSFQNSRTSGPSGSLQRTNRYLLGFTQKCGSSASCSMSTSGDGKVINIMDKTSGSTRCIVKLIDSKDVTSTISIATSGTDVYKTLALYEF